MSAAAAASVVVLAVGAVLLGSPGGPAVAAAEMRAASGGVIGRVVLHDDEPTLLSMTLAGWADQIDQYGLTDGGYTVRIETDDGHVTTRPLTVTDDACLGNDPRHRRRHRHHRDRRRRCRIHLCHAEFEQPPIGPHRCPGPDSTMLRRTRDSASRLSAQRANVWAADRGITEHAIHVRASTGRSVSPP